MRTPSPFAVCTLLLGFWLGCGSSLGFADSADSPTSGGSGGAAGSNAGGSGDAGSSFAGAAGTNQSGAAGGAEGDKIMSPVSAGCEACLHEICPQLCPDIKVACDPCYDDPAHCNSPTAGAASQVKECACDSGAKCKESCADSPLLCVQASVPFDNAGAGGTAVGAGGASGAAGNPGPAGQGGSAASGAAGAVSPGGAAGSPAAGTGGNAGTTDECDNLQNEILRGCADGLDNNCDLKVDCDDTLCAAACEVACATPTPITVGATFNASLKGRKNSFDPTCAASPSTGPDAAYVFTAPADGLLRVSLASLTTNMVLSLRQKCGGGSVDIVCQDAVDAGIEEVSRPVKQGETLFFVVGAALPGVEGDYSLSVALTTPMCGDGEVQPGEDCDESGQNGQPGSGCSAKCEQLSCKNAVGITDATEPSYEFSLQPGDTSLGESHLTPSCSLLGSSAPELVYSIRPVRSGRLEVELEPDSGVDLTLSVRSACNTSGSELSCVDGAKAGGMERLSVPATAGEIFYLVVDGYDSTQIGKFTLKVRSVSAICGDGVPSLAEQCDSPSPAVCTERCTSTPKSGLLLNEAGLGPEAAMPLVDSSAQSEIYPAGDADTYAITLTPDQTQFTATITAAGQEPCSAQHLDSQLEILDAQGVLVAFNDDSSEAGGFCSQVTAAGLAGGATYRVRVRSSQTFAPSQVFSYKLLVESK